MAARRPAPSTAPFAASLPSALTPGMGVTDGCGVMFTVGLGVPVGAAVELVDVTVEVLEVSVLDGAPGPGCSRPTGSLEFHGMPVTGSRYQNRRSSPMHSPNVTSW